MSPQFIANRFQYMQLLFVEEDRFLENRNWNQCSKLVSIYSYPLAINFVDD